MDVLIIDVGGTHIKVASSQNPVPIKIVSGPDMTAKMMVEQVLEAVSDWTYDCITIGYPGPVEHDRPLAEPHNLGSGWVGFPFQSALPKPVRFINDAAMQALGGYKGGKMLFLGTGTGLGAAIIAEGVILPLEIAHLPYKHGHTYEEYVGLAGLERRGHTKWRRSVRKVIRLFQKALLVDYVVLGGGNAKLMKKLPEGVLLGANSNAVLGGIALWKSAAERAAVPAGDAPPFGQIDAVDQEIGLRAPRSPRRLPKKGKAGGKVASRKRS
jgi:polyphosphate glucokinase